MLLVTLADPGLDLTRGLALLALVGESLQRLLVVALGLLVALFAARRADRYGVSHHAVGNQLIVGLLIAVPVAYQAIVIRLYDADPAWAVGSLGPGLAIQLGLTALLLVLLAGLHLRRLPLLTILDICAIPVLVGQLLGGLVYALSRASLAGPGQSAAPAWAYLLLWDLAALGAILWIERRFRGRMRPGDTVLLCCLFVALGRVGLAGLRSSIL